MIAPVVDDYMKLADYESDYEADEQNNNTPCKQPRCYKKDDFGRIRDAVNGVPVAERLHVELSDATLQHTLLFIFATIADAEDIFRMSNTPIEEFVKQVSWNCTWMQIKYSQSWEYCKHNDAKMVTEVKLNELHEIVGQMESMSEGVKLAIESNAQSKFKILLLFLNLATLMGTYLYSEYFCSNE